jgi:hypothetical protein
VGSITSGGQKIAVNLTTEHGKSGKGSMSTNGLKLDFIRIGDTIYIRGSDAFYRHFAGPTFVPLLHDKWLKGPATHGRLEPLAQLTSLRALFNQINAGGLRLANDGKRAYKGRQVVVLRDRSDGSKLYVAATGKPYPVAIVGGKQGGDTGTVTFGDWNKPVSLSAPSGTLDISTFGG